MKATLSLMLFLASFALNAQSIHTTTSRSSSISYSEGSSLKERMLLDVVSTDNISSYQVEYELLDYNFIAGDSSILDLINMQEIYAIRLTDEDMVLSDLEHGVTILLYSYSKSLNRRKGELDTETNRD